MTATLTPFTATADGERVRLYREIARKGPVAHVVLPSGLPVWLITGYDAVRRVLNDPRLVKAPSPLGRIVGEIRPDEIDNFRSHLLASDGEVHARQRRLVSAAFARRAVERLEPRIQELADGFLDDLGRADPDAVVDLYAGFAYPLPMAVICELMGVPEEHRARFHELAVTIWTRGLFIPRDELGEAIDEIFAMILGWVADKRARPDEGLISALVAARDGEDRLSEEELTSMVLLLTVAGHETTVNLLGNGTAALLSHPEQFARLRAEPELLPRAIEELLRYVTPVQTTFPVVGTEAVEIDGVTIPAGEPILPAVLAANRDPARIEDPDTLDITRSPNHHLGLGHGPHHCLGASLARLEARVGFGALLQRYPELSLAVDPSELTWQPNVLFHGLAALPVRLGKPA